MTSRQAVGTTLALLSAAVVVLTGCGSSTSEESGGASGNEGGSRIQVVASTNVYGDIVKQVGGDAVDVKSIIADASQDPHSYEADARTQLALSKADLVVENGGGYDDFVDRMLDSSDNKPTTVNVVKLSGKKAPAGGELNEHVWYDLPTVEKLTARLVKDFSSENPADASLFRSNAASFTAKLRTLILAEAGVRKAHAGEGVAITEPVPLYLLQACGLVNRTPEDFSEAIEEGEGVPVRVLDETLDLFSGDSVKVLAYNEQTSGPETERVLAAAKKNGVAVVPMTETLPDGKDYVSWMRGNISAMRTALG